MQRLIGLLLLIRAFTPVLIALICVWLLNQMLTDLRTAVALPVRAIDHEVAALQAAAAEAEAKFAELNGYVDTAVSTLQRFNISQLVPNLPVNFSLPSINVPDVNIPIPSSVNVQFTSISGQVRRAVDDCSNIPIIGLICDGIKFVTDQVNVSYPSGISVGTSNFRINMPTIPSLNVPIPNVFGPMVDGINSLFSGLADIFDIFEPAIASITRLGESTQALADNFGILLHTAEEVWNAVTAILGRYTSLFLLGALAIGVLVILSFASAFVDNLTRGLSLLFGRTPTINSQEAA